jgi:DMSO/TMAO reductase YedYZ molybdopterin-dependent catalytic subunit
VTEKDAPRGSPDPGSDARDAGKPIGRRAFLGLMAAGVVAFVFGRDATLRLGGDVTTTQVAASASNKPPPADPDKWQLTVEGLVDKQLTLSWKDLLALPQVEVTSGFRCVDGWRVQPRQWKGVRLREVLALAGVSRSATHLVFHSSDTAYTDSLTTDEAGSDEVLLAHTLDGEFLSQEHGRPVRLVVPDRYGYKYVKWLTSIEAIAPGAEGYRGYWESFGYPVDARMN